MGGAVDLEILAGGGIWRSRFGGKSLVMVQPLPAGVLRVPQTYHESVYYAVFCFSLEHHDLQESKLMPPKGLKPLKMLEHQKLMTAHTLSNLLGQESEEEANSAAATHAT